MSKRTGQKKCAPRARTARASGPVFFEHPLSTIPREQALSGLAELGRASQTQLATGLQELVNILRSVEPLQTIATLAAYGLTAGVKSSGEMSPLYKDPRFGQAHVELAQAIALSLAIEGQPVRPPRPTEIQRLFEILPDIGSAFGLQRLGRAQEDLSSEEKSVVILQQRLRMHTQSVRNWGFFDRVLRIVTALHQPLDHAFLRHLGLSATQVITVFHRLLRRTEEALTARLSDLREVITQRSDTEMIREYFARTPGCADSAEDLLAFVRQERLTREQVESRIISHADLRLPSILTMSTDELNSSP